MIRGFSHFFTDVTFIAVSAGSFVAGVCLGWIMNHKKGKCKNESAANLKDEESFSDFGNASYKLVLVVNNSLKMGKGKIAAQCSHASVLAYRHACYHIPDVLKKWERSGQMKVVVKADDEVILTELIIDAQRAGLLANLVRDAGRTQIPSGSKTVVAIGPGPADLLDTVTGHLKLL